MNYESIYRRLIESQKLNKVGEVHHIIPRSLGGGDDAHNLVTLSYKAHLLAHHLLSKMYSGKDRRKMLYAYYMLRTGGRRHARVKPFTVHEFEEFRLLCSQKMKEDNPMKNRASVEKMLKTRGCTKGIPRSEDFRKKRSENMIGNKRACGKKSEDHKRKISDAHIGMNHTEETKNKLRQLTKKQNEQNRVCSIANKKEYSAKTFLSLISRGIPV